MQLQCPEQKKHAHTCHTFTDSPSQPLHKNHRNALVSWESACPQYPVDLPGYNDASHCQWHIWPEVMELHMNCKSVSLSTVIFDVVFAVPFCSSICQPRFCFKSCTVLGKSSQFRESHAPSLSWECGTDMAVWRQTSLKSLALLSKRPTETEARPSTTHNVVLDLTNWQHNCENERMESFRIVLFS